MNNKHIGRFKVSRQFLESIANFEGASLFTGMIVLRATESFMTDTVEYIAVHPDFREKENGEIIPEYVAHFSSDSHLPKWAEVE